VEDDLLSGGLQRENEERRGDERRKGLLEGENWSRLCHGARGERWGRPVKA